MNNKDFGDATLVEEGTGTATFVEEDTNILKSPKLNIEIQARTSFKELMADLVPDLIKKKEILDVHLFFVKKMANEAGWDGDEIASNLSDFLTMYNDFKQDHTKGDSFSNIEKRLLTYQASFAHIDQSTLDEIF